MTDQATSGNPTHDAHYDHPHPRKGFFTDTSICIGCKACEVACKEWNRNPVDSDYELLGSSYDNTGGLGANTWRHVAFIEQGAGQIERARESGRALVNLGMPQVGPPQGSVSPTTTPQGTIPVTQAAPAGCGSGGGGCGCGGSSSPDSSADTSDDQGTVSPVDASVHPDTPDFRWLMSSDVCKHCTNAGCLDVCPTGALFRTEYGTVVVQDDICNGCGTCVAGCPFGVIERRSDGVFEPKNQRDSPPMPDTVKVPEHGLAQKCTLCYDRMKNDQTPACAQACPTTSIKYGDRDSMVATARERVAQMHEQGKTEARLYGANPKDGVGGTGSVFLLLDEPETYGLPPDPRVPTADLPYMFKRAGMAVAGMLAVGAVAFVSGGRR
ncbi:4Fe-4S dicluster domain-containing protein [Kocuria carniphila]|uniref:4Fe-4S dicluster domain-containing protein n=1 Tax=Kocuria carniphila TaxID=262208 RepID=UPI0021A69BA5|nr:4Fe-4S dicluster domain-containing protein [Kocuria carniphila]MCT1803827.1 4Fe-4S dicluster domain-containing protein [Kocuria carniphila]